MNAQRLHALMVGTPRPIHEYVFVFFTLNPVIKTCCLTRGMTLLISCWHIVFEVGKFKVKVTLDGTPSPAALDEIGG